jgi:glycosyltransferase involved in cell wall biosynthesis
MASGGIVVGFTGNGGQEYATAENGFWFAPDHLEEVADTLAKVIVGVENNDPAIQEMREAAFATAAQYDKEQTRHALAAFYGPLAD